MAVSLLRFMFKAVTHRDGFFIKQLCQSYYLQNVVTFGIFIALIQPNVACPFVVA